MVFQQGDVLKIFYFMTLTKYRRMFSFIGICVNKTSQTFTLQNYHNSEFVIMSFFLNSPNLISLHKLTSYNFSFNQKRLHNIKRFKLFKKTDIISLNLLEKRQDPLPFFYKPVTIYPKEKKRIRNKFRL